MDKRSRCAALGVLPLWTACSLVEPSDRAEPAVLWRVPARGWSVLPVVDSSAAYFASFDHEVLAIDRRSGIVRWRQNTGITSSYTEGSNLVLAASSVAVPDFYVHAYDRLSGQKRWNYLSDRPLEYPGLMYLASDSMRIFAGTHDTRVHAIFASDGTPAWVATLPGADSTTGAFGAFHHAGTVYVGLATKRPPERGALVALDAATGAVRWTREFLEPSYPGALLGCYGRGVVIDDLVIVPIRDGRIVALDRTSGVERWAAPRVHPIPPDPLGYYADGRGVAIAAGVLIGTSNSGIVVGLDPATGVELWRRSGIVTDGDAATSAGSSALILTNGGQLFALNPASGSVRWVIGAATSGAVRASIMTTPVHADGVVYLATTEAFVALRP